MVRPVLGRNARRAACVTLAVLLCGASGAGAQIREPGPFTVGVGLLNTQPLGALRTGPGVGIGLTGGVALDAARRLRIRADLRFASYGMDERRACLSQTVGCWIQVDITTNYHTIFAGLGPEVAVPVLGSELVLVATGGLGYFGVSSSLSGIDEASDGFGDTTHFDDAFFAWSTGGELRMPVSRVLAVALGAQYQHNGRASYVPDGGVTENPDGSLDVAAVTSDANMAVVTLGVVIRPLLGRRGR